MLLLRDISSFLTANVGIFSELYKKFGKYCHYLYLCRLKMNKMDIVERLRQRILILDGAMGTKIQSQGLTPDSYHQGRFAQWPVSLVGNNDVLCLTAPEVIADIHRQYVEAGADIITTNTFSETVSVNMNMAVRTMPARWLSREHALPDRWLIASTPQMSTVTFSWQARWVLRQGRCRWLPT